MIKYITGEKFINKKTGHIATFKAYVAVGGTDHPSGEVVSLFADETTKYDYVIGFKVFMEDYLPLNLSSRVLFLTKDK